MMVKMGVSEQEMADVLGELPDDVDEIPHGIIKKIMDQYELKEEDVLKMLATYGK